MHFWVGEDLSKVDWIRGTEATEQLIRHLQSTDSQRLDESIQKTHYGWFLPWQDTFLRCWTKQRLNNVWIYTITFPLVSQISSSKFHTYCLAVGPGHLDHTPVIDYYANEYARMMNGNVYYCAHRKEFVNVKLGPVACMADRPEKAFELKTSLLGTYGQIANHAGEIVFDLFPDCTRCYVRRLQHVFDDPHSRVNLNPCASCMQWDLNCRSEAAKKVNQPEKYPTSCHPDSPPVPEDHPMGARYILFVRQTFAFLKQAVALAEFNARKAHWNKVTVTA